MFDIYTDGGCNAKKGGLGAWAFVAVEGDKAVHTAAEASWGQTNNTMELLAVVKALEWVPQWTQVRITSDSQYVVKGATEWSKNWVSNNWRTYDNRRVKNRDLWERLLPLLVPRVVTFVHVRGHKGNRWNEHCDQLCTAAMKSLYDAK